ncbi:AsmA family protein [Myxococcaceae bacterium GXIMD 01537]
MSEPKKKRWPYIVGGVFVLLVLAVALVLARLDALLLTEARAQAVKLSTQLGRPVEVGGISTQLIPHVGAEVKGVSIGAAEGEEAPLAQLQNLNVRVALMPLLRSSGKDIQVLNAEATGLTLNVVRLPDGTTNVQRLQERFAKEQPPEETPKAEEKPTDLSGVRVDRVALTDGVIRFIDRSGPKTNELAIQDLDIEVKDLRVGKPLDVTLAAAVFAPKQNLHATLHAAPLPATLVPTPERFTLKADKLDLAPLGPYLPPDVGLQAGTLDADWKAELGSVVPGGQGPTRFVGMVRALGLRFAGSEGGKALDAVLDTDVTADLGAGNVALDKLDVKLGPASLEGKGRVQSLMSETPKVEGFELVGRNLDPAVLAEYYPPLRKQLQGRIAGPIGFVVRGSGTQAAQALTADVDLTPVKLRVPGQLTKEAGAPMKLTARVSGAAASGGALRFDAKADLDGVDMRPGLLLNKPAGRPFNVSAAGTYSPARGSNPLKVDLSQLGITLLDNVMNGTASVALGGQGKAQTTAFTLNLKSPRLDADALLLPEQEVVARNGGQPVPVSTDATRFNGYRGQVHVEAGAVRYMQMDLTQLVADIKMVDDLITVEHFSTGIYGGKVAADGTSIRLGPVPEKRPFEAKVKAQGIDMKQAMAAFTPKQVLGGSFNGNVDLKGVGYTPDKLQQSLLGAINGNLADGTFLGADIVSELSGPLAKALPFTGKALSNEHLTSLGESLPFGVKIQNGVALLDKPITWTRPEAAMSFDGGIRLDGTLDLKGTVGLSPSTIKTLTGGKVTPTEPVPLAVSLTGKAWSPQVTGLDLKPAALMIGKQAATGLAGQLLGDKAKPVQDLIQGGQDKARQEAEARLAEERKKAEEAVRAEKERQQKQLEEEAKKKLRGLFGK